MTETISTAVFTASRWNGDTVFVNAVSVRSIFEKEAKTSQYIANSLRYGAPEGVSLVHFFWLATYALLLTLKEKRMLLSEWRSMRWFWNWIYRLSPRKRMVSRDSPVEETLG